MKSAKGDSDDEYNVKKLMMLVFERAWNDGKVFFAFGQGECDNGGDPEDHSADCKTLFHLLQIFFMLINFG